MLQLSDCINQEKSINFQIAQIEIYKSGLKLFITVQQALSTLNLYKIEPVSFFEKTLQLNNKYIDSTDSSKWYDVHCASYIANIPFNCTIRIDDSICTNNIKTRNFKYDPSNNKPISEIKIPSSHSTNSFLIQSKEHILVETLSKKTTFAPNAKINSIIST